MWTRLSIFLMTGGYYEPTSIRVGVVSFSTFYRQDWENYKYLLLEFCRLTSIFKSRPVSSMLSVIQLVKVFLQQFKRRCHNLFMFAGLWWSTAVLTTTNCQQEWSFGCMEFWHCFTWTIYGHARRYKSETHPSRGESSNNELIFHTKSLHYTTMNWIQELKHGVYFLLFLNECLIRSWYKVLGGWCEQGWPGQ